MTPIDQTRIIRELTSADNPPANQLALLESFARTFGWKPSDYFEPADDSEFARAHLLVEHGLENTVVISFLTHPYRYSDLSLSQKTSLLSVSYNNLVDWHIPISYSECSTVYNRVSVAQSNAILQTSQISSGNLDSLRSEAFSQIIGRKPNPNLPALDEALTSTISFWKLRISAELENSISTEAISSLFNAIIFARAVEDHHRRFSRSSPRVKSKMLIEGGPGFGQNIRTIIRRVVETLLRENQHIPSYLLNDEVLKAFDDLSPETVWALLSDFYTWRSIPYEYDFSVMSKHALSRIYERYVSILQIVEDVPSKQPVLFDSNFSLPKEESTKAFGAIYTPQFIAKFFAKFLRDRLPPRDFLNAKIVDPACGSGIFLRTLLELRYENLLLKVDSKELNYGFLNTLGVDIDPNATQATRLSLALLFLALADDFPSNLNVIDAEAIEYIQTNPDLAGSFDAVLANPPFVANRNQPVAIRERIAEFMGNSSTGVADAYFPFLLIALELLKPGGIGFFVLPHSFLLTKSAKKIREKLIKESWILCLADLSAISVFEKVGAYAVLLIFQKKNDGGAPEATIVKCQDFVSRALQAVLNRTTIEDKFYSVYNVTQEAFEDAKSWIVLPPSESSLIRKFEQLPEITEFLNVQQGFKAGNDVFIVSVDQIPEGEGAIFIPYLRDREMRGYVVPETVNTYFFYPFKNDRYITEKELSEEFPRTWDYLCSHKSELEKRTDVVNGDLAWWKPQRPRLPGNMKRPKIISPRMVISPRFSIDLSGKYAVASIPFLTPKDVDAEDDILRFFVAVLNSQPCFWFIANNSHVYRGGYSRLDVNTLKKTRVPDLSSVSVSTRQHVLTLVNRRLLASGTVAIELEKEIDLVVADLYQLSDLERRTIGMY